MGWLNGKKKPPKRSRGKTRGHDKGKVRGGAQVDRGDQTKASRHSHNGNGKATQDSTHVYVYCTCGELYSSYNKKDL